MIEYISVYLLSVLSSLKTYFNAVYSKYILKHNKNIQLQCPVDIAYHSIPNVIQFDLV